MIGQLKGRLLEKHAPLLLLDVGGVGYEVNAPMTTFYRLPDIGQEVLLHTHFVVREDAQLLYGFFDLQERTLFRTLIKVNGVGPKMALAILSGIETEVFVRCVLDSDITTLTKVPGVGKKTAERLIIEMRDRLKDLQAFSVNPEASGGSVLSCETSPVQDAISALEALGYKSLEASKAISLVKCEDTTSSEELIRLALKGLAR